MAKKVYTHAPERYNGCIYDDCPVGQTCLRRIAYLELVANHDYIHMVNPTRCTKNRQCPYYRDSKPQRYARGFRGMQGHMYPGQYLSFMRKLINIFGRNAYFERRRGASALSPWEQSLVRQTLKEVGADPNMEFDAYEENINWWND